MTEYTVTVELFAKAKPDLADALLDGLADFHPAVFPADSGQMAVTVSLPAENLRQACSAALAVVEAAAGRPALGVEALPSGVRDERDGVPPLPPLLSVGEAAEMLGVSKQRVVQLVDSGQMPAQRVGRAIVVPRAAVEQRVERVERG